MPCYLYVSVSGEHKIAIYRLDRETGDLTFQEDIPVGGGLMPLAVNPTLTRLYAGVRFIPEIQTYRINRQNGSLERMAHTPVESDPCYLTTDRTGRYLLSAHYTGGRVGVHALDAEGVVAVSPIEWRDTAPCAHFIQTDATNRFAYVPHVAASNRIDQFVFDETTGQLHPGNVPSVHFPPDTGPRHYVHHPSMNMIYVDNEQGSSVTAFRMDKDTGTLVPAQTVPTLPEDFNDPNTCAQIRIHPSGRFLYVSNRGHDSIACFAVDDKNGALSVIGHQPTETTPRAFNLDPDGRFLFAAGQGSGRLAGYRVDPRAGSLTPLATYEVGAGPCWVMMLDL